MEDLSSRQKAILTFIRSYTNEHGYPPSIREIGQEVAITSTSVVNYNLNVLQRKGYLERCKEISRGLRLIEEPDVQLPLSSAATFGVPLLGRIAAGEPIPLPDSDFSAFDSEMIALTSDIAHQREGMYALRVKGNSMIDALVNDGDIVVMQPVTWRVATDTEVAVSDGDLVITQPVSEVENGAMVAAWLKNERETTLKHFYWEQEQRMVRLQPANPSFAPIYVRPDNLEIQGKVVAVIRHI